MEGFAFLESWLLYKDLALALGLGLLIGLERGWRSRGEPDGARVAGLRTFGLLGLIGGIAGLLHRAVDPVVAIIVVAATALALGAGYVRDMRAGGSVSATSFAAALLTLCLGFLATNDFAVPAVAVAAIVTLLLASRKPLHRWLQGLDAVDVQATARFAIITAVVLPLLPDRRFGPYEAWNPRELWLVVILVTGFSFAGYVANKRFGARNGTLATAAIGGMYSSTAVTAALAARLKKEPEGQPILAAGIAIASALMFLRVLLLTAILATSALPVLAIAVGPATVVALLAAFRLVWRKDRAQQAQDASVGGNPFELLPALGFAALVAATALATRWAEARFGDAGAATLIAITGSFDVDAAIVTLGGLPAGTLEPRLAGLVLAVPVLVNTAFKAGIVILTAGWTRGRPAALPLLASAGAILLMIVLLTL